MCICEPKLLVRDLEVMQCELSVVVDRRDRINIGAAFRGYANGVGIGNLQKRKVSGHVRQQGVFAFCLTIGILLARQCRGIDAGVVILMT